MSIYILIRVGFFLEFFFGEGARATDFDDGCVIKTLQIYAQTMVPTKIHT